MHKPFRTIALLAALAAVFGCAPHSAKAQIPTYTTPQTVQAILAPTGTACTGSAQIFAQGSVTGFQNIGQTQHYAYISTTVGITRLIVQIQGVDAAGNVYALSDVGMGLSTSATNITVSGSGYFPKIQVSVTCNLGGQFGLSYSGTSSTSNQNVGSYQVAQLAKVLATQASDDTTITFPSFATSPFGTGQGLITFIYTGGVAGPAGSTISIACSGQTQATGTQTWALATTTGVQQSFPVAPIPCPLFSVTYTAGGATGGAYQAEYIFQQQSVPPAYLHVTGTTATAVKNGYGILDSVVIGTGTAGTISFFDLAPVSCTGTPATNVVSVITAGTTTPPPIAYGSTFRNGICVKASVAMDFTVNYH